MHEKILRRQAKMYALVAEMHAINASVEGMKAANIERELQGYALAYNESFFNYACKNLEEIAIALREQI